MLFTIHVGRADGGRPNKLTFPKEYTVTGKRVEEVHS
jgi:hypothetical protein